MFKVEKDEIYATFAELSQLCAAEGAIPMARGPPEREHCNDVFP